MTPCRIGLSLCIAAALFLSGSPGSAAETAPALHSVPCTMGKTRVAAQCGYLRVFEDRVAGRGRTIDIHFVVLRAKRPTHRAIFFNPGGPGASATIFAPFAADGRFQPYLARLRDRYDIVFVDNRGTGDSHRLGCRLYDPSNPQPYYKELWPNAALAACRAKLAAAARLDKYGTIPAADDLDDIRAALQYPRIALSGVSGGTTFFLAYARRHPTRVESLLLQGVGPPHFLIIPLEDARGAQLAVDHLTASCEHDALCRTHFPAFRAHFASLVARLSRGPIDIGIVNSATHRKQTVRLTKEVFADRLRQTLYGADSAAYVPYIIERAYAGDDVPLGAMIENAALGLGRLVPAGSNLSITCAEDIPFITERAVAKDSAGTFMGDLRVRAQQRACRIWNVHPVEAAFQEPVRTNAPVFMISGADDPTTPPEYSLAALRYFPNGARLQIVNAAHDTQLPCAMALAERFIRAQSVHGLQTGACAAQNRRPPFALSFAGFEPN
jgi:pimeloyl-ACP methyl ester carboxylesterase